MVQFGGFKWKKEQKCIGELFGLEPVSVVIKKGRLRQGWTPTGSNADNGGRWDKIEKSPNEDLIGLYQGWYEEVEPVLRKGKVQEESREKGKSRGQLTNPYSLGKIWHKNGVCNVHAVMHFHQIAVPRLLTSTSLIMSLKNVSSSTVNRLFFFDIW